LGGGRGRGGFQIGWLNDGSGGIRCAVLSSGNRFFSFGRGVSGVFIELYKQVAPAIIDAFVVEAILLIQFVF
jgi:hypothetical protein